MDTFHTDEDIHVLEVITYSFGGVPLLSLAGDFDHSSAALFGERASQALESGGTSLLLQLTDTTYIDSGGVSVLLALLHTVRNRGWLGISFSASSLTTPEAMRETSVAVLFGNWFL